MSARQEQLMADISDYQPTYIARRYRRAGRRAIMIKATEGVGEAGAESYVPRVEASHAVGLIVVHYLFADFDFPPRASVDTFIERIKPHWRAGDRMLIDVEEYSGPVERAAEWLFRAQQALSEIHDAPRALGYSNEAYLAEGGSQLAANAPYWLVADYDGRLLEDGGRPIPPAKARLLGKQYTDGVVGSEPHEAPGIGPCDDSILTGAGMVELFGAQRAKLKRARL